MITIQNSYNASVARCLLLQLRCDYRRLTDAKAKRRVQRKIDRLMAALVHYHLAK